MSSASEGSRLGKLLALLESEHKCLNVHLIMLMLPPSTSLYTDVFAAGSSLDIRKVAAEQVATIAQTHPAQLPPLLRYVSLYFSLGCLLP